MVIGGTGNNFITSANATHALPASGDGAPTPTARYQLSPNATVVGRDFAVKISNAAAGGSRIFTLMVNDSPGLSCTLTGPALTCDSGPDTVTIPPLSTLYIRQQSSAAGSDAFASWGWRATTP
jgi:hypothetical protein